ncbi:MAG: DNA-3-methyladenine glycosylase [Planctomycetota bacterium]
MNITLLPPLKIDFYDREVTTVAEQLIGKLLCRQASDGLTIGRIVETEAYLSTGDSASHSCNGRNRKNSTMFGSAGRAYIYTIHARQCFNVVTESEGIGSAVLIRALEPLHGLPLMQMRRRTNILRDLCRGPARLCEAKLIDRDFDGWDLSRGDTLWIAADEESSSPRDVRISSRIGVTSAHDLPLRFFIAGSPFISGPKKLNK